MHKAICRHDCRWSITDQSCQSESFRPFLLSTRYVAALCKIYTKFLSVYTQYCTHYRKQMNCENNFMGLIPTIIFKWSLVPLISFPVPPLQWNMVVRHQAVGVFFSDWGREAGQGWGKAKWSSTSILTNLQQGKTATLVSSYPRRLEAEKNEILFSLQGYLCVFMNVYLIFMVLFHLFHAVFISWGLTYWDPMVPQEATDEQTHITSWMKDPHSAPFLCNRWVWRTLSGDTLTLLLSYVLSDLWCSSLFVLEACLSFKILRFFLTQIAAKPDGQTVAMSTSSLRRQVKNIVHNYSEAEIKVAFSSAHVDFPHPHCHVSDLKAARASWSIRLIAAVYKVIFIFPNPLLSPCDKNGLIISTLTCVILALACLGWGCIPEFNFLCRSQG